ncbi:MAG: AraC family transcriptional regulator [Bacteroidota bacterium]
MAILSQRHMELGGQQVISHVTFEPPLVISSELDRHGCFIFPINTSGEIYRQDGKTKVEADQGVLMKCGTYVNKWNHPENADLPSEVVILRFYPQIIEAAIDAKNLQAIKNRMSNRSTALVEMDILMKKYLESLSFYFDNPRLVNDELVNLKFTELLLLLVSIREPNAALDLLSTLFDSQKFSLKEIVDSNAFEKISIDELASLANMSTPTFKRKFKESMGESPGQYIKKLRLRTAANMLDTSKELISAIAYECGFSDPNYFSKSFQSVYGLSPKQYRNR